MFTNKQNTVHTPDMGKLKPVMIDRRTQIFVPIDMDPETARERYWSNRPEMDRQKHFKG